MKLNGEMAVEEPTRGRSVFRFLTSGGRSDQDGLQAICWVILILAGLVQTWYYRHLIFSDGVSYLDIAKNYASGNWHAALNDYWSPLYSWMLALLLVCVRPSAYWEISLIHVVNFGAYVLALVGFELWLNELIRFQRRVIAPDGLSEQTIRIVGYSAFLISSLLLVGIGQNSPDMIATAILYFLAYFLHRMERGAPGSLIFVCFGILLGLEYLARAAFAPLAVLYLMVAAILLWERREKPIRRLAYAGVASLAVALPFVIALSASKGHFTLGEAGKLNYGWEISGAARSIHWQGEPYDIGKPLHPTHKVFDHPAVYTFAEPVPGTYPPWYEPSYWYAGIAPRFKAKQQIAVLLGSIRTLIYIFVRSPFAVPVFLLIFFMGWRAWLSGRGILAFWFLLVPTLAYVAGYMVVYLDARYIAGPLVILWVCLAASISLPHLGIRRLANAAMQAVALLIAIGYIGARLVSPAVLDAKDLIHHREAEWNVNWVIAQRLHEMGVGRNDRIGLIGQSIDAEWPSMVGSRIIAEVPVIWDRQGGWLRKIRSDRSEIDAFWRASPAQKARVYEAFRQAGVTVLAVDKLPDGVDTQGWERVLPPGTPHLPPMGTQMDSYLGMAIRRLAPPPDAGSKQ